ncbi:hypothetical protein FocTR4_00009353 [Fusarium oxysporum f. sp. cubense]|uniref:Uncharacterized protein n=1 Tax=Fusarium oxysporum f. sp. cubense TaxID=61366 RepID=A0A5C6ST77_FUSOC|nr:hypothetical protein FocTR4_00009353 [Fusarium oxysporum f. sp. cubense]
MKHYRNDVTGIFMKRLDAITEIVKEQLDQAMDIGYAVENVVIGGFGNSPSLIAKLKEFLEGYHRENNCHVKLMTSQEGTTITNAVSEGAVLCTLEKENGPRRIARSSYCILTNEPEGSYP